jgi:hypothetical protein
MMNNVPRTAAPLYETVAKWRQFHVVVELVQLNDTAPYRYLSGQHDAADLRIGNFFFLEQ